MARILISGTRGTQVGFDQGATLARMAAIAGFVAGIDVSREMRAALEAVGLRS